MTADQVLAEQMRREVKGLCVNCGTKIAVAPHRLDLYPELCTQCWWLRARKDQNEPRPAQ